MKRWLLFAVLLTGCAANFHVTRPGMTDAALRRDEYECERDARQSMPQMAPVIAILIGAPQRDFDAFYQRCLEARGYTVKRD